MATSIHPSIPVLSLSFLYHPYIPSFQSKYFSFTCNNKDNNNYSSFKTRDSWYHRLTTLTDIYLAEVQHTIATKVAKETLYYNIPVEEVIKNRTP